LNFYEAGSWGPEIAEGLFNEDKWVNPGEWLYEYLYLWWKKFLFKKCV
jgi:hypothetical protein